MILAIVGSVTLKDSDDVRKIVNNILDEFSPFMVVSGGAEGVDTIAKEEAQKRNIPVREFLPEKLQWSPQGYKERNLRIAAFCDALVRIKDSASKTYGSGWTRDRARDMGKPTREYVL